MPTLKLRERVSGPGGVNFRLVFTSTTISGLGDGVATIALAFAVLDISDSRRRWGR